MEFETIEAAAASMGTDEWLCYYPATVWGEEATSEEAPHGWDDPMTDEEFGDLLETAEEEGW